MIQVQAGDEVVVRSGSWDDVYGMERVKRVTPSGQIVLDNGTRYMPDGWEIGGGRHIEKATNEERARVRRQEVQQELRAILSRIEGKVHSMDLEQLERLHEALSWGLDG